MNKAIVISVDAMITRDLSVLKNMKELKEFFSNCAQVNEVMPVFPSLTYPCHVTMLTGCYPDRHGIVNNELFMPGVKNAPWYWYTTYHKERTLFKEAKDAGLVTALVAWPSSGCCPDIDHRISKIFALGAEEDVNSSSVKEIYDRHKHLLNGFRTIELDDFAEVCTVDIIKKFSPDLLFTYFLEIDSVRHKKGVDTSLHVESLERIGRRISHIYEEVKKSGYLNDTTFFLTADHGQIDTRYTFNINQALMEKGYITTNEDGLLLSWRIIAHSSAFTAQIYTKDISHVEAKEVLREIGREHPGTVERILNRYECESLYHTTGDFTFMIEGSEGVSFGKDVNVPLVVEPGKGDYKTAKATHGHSPERGPKPPFVITGKMARDSAVVEEASLVDEAPTILASLGIAMDRADGHVLSSLIKEDEGV